MSNDTRKLECDEAIRMLLEYLDNELEQHDNNAMENHIHTCRSCFTRMEFEKRLKNMVKDANQENAPVDLRQRIRKITDIF